jgi:multicomponent Na+:H+ antiporter subunit D
MGLAPSTLVWLAVLIPLVGSAVIPLFRTSPNLREGTTLITAVALLLAVAGLLPAVANGLRPELTVLTVAPGLELAFKVEPLGMLFALVASALWIVNSIYSIGYMRAGNEPRQTVFYVCFAIALGSTIGIAFAKNLFTLFLFYEALTLSTYPLVTHKQNEAAIRAGRLYIILLMGTSIVLLLPAIVVTWLLAGTIDFVPGGILGGKASPLVVGGLLALYVWGVGKAALMPGHFWLPAAMVAPTPVSALLHAVAVVKAGVFAILKIVIYVFGLETLATTGAADWLIFVASFSLVTASLVALMKDNLKARLAYSTVSQLAYVVLGAALANSTAAIGAGLQIATHAAGKITLFFCAGAIYVAAHKTEVSQLDGIGRRMPVTMIAFLIGSLSIIGMPPFGGMWSKWTLALGAADAGNAAVVGVFMLSSVLSAAYLLPIVARAFFVDEADAPKGPVRIAEAPAACLVALSITALLSVALFFGAGYIESLLKGTVAP